MAKLKIQRLKEKYSFSDLDSELKEAYVIEDQSLRDVASQINLELTRQFLESEPFEAELVCQVYRHPDELTKQTRTELKKRIQEHGIDIDELKGDWIGHLAVKSYLNRVLDIDTSRTKARSEPKEALSDISGLIDYQENLINRHLDKVRNFDEDKWELHTELRLINTETGESVRLQEYFDKLQEELETENPTN